MVDTEIFNNNEDITIGDNCIVFNTKNGDKHVLSGGGPPAVGDKVVVLPTKEGDLVTHGNSRIGVGDRVIVVPLADGDMAALSPGINPWRDCPIQPKTTLPDGEEHDPPDDTYQHHSYVIELVTPLDPFEEVNVRFDFEVGCDERGFQPWYPCGGVWLGLGAADTQGDRNSGTWYWPGGNPFMVIRGQPMTQLGPNAPAPVIGSLSNNGTTWCIENFLHGLYPYGRADWDVKYIYVHISQQSSLYFYNYTRSTLNQASICAGGPVRDGWCDELTVNQFGSL